MGAPVEGKNKGKKQLFIHLLLFLDGPALVVLALVCANIRNSSLPSTKLRALDILLALSINLTDEAKLDRLLPYVTELLHDETPVVRAAALRTTLQVVRALHQPTNMLKQRDR